MKRILISLSVIGLVSAVAFGATKAYFNDVETSSGNTFTAGSVDLKIDLQCAKEYGCDFTLRDLDDRVFFNEYDIKPGDTDEVTISWHVNDNKAWGRIRLADIVSYENGCNDSEADLDSTCGDPGRNEGELDDNLIFTLWMDEGQTAGWQCPVKNNGSCSADPLEGDNILNGVEQVLAKKTASELIAGVELPELDSNSTYYLGFQWNVPFETSNIIQTDSITGKIIMEVEQSRHNPNPWD